MSRLSPHRDHADGRFPRVSGDEPGIQGEREVTERFSPRERG